MTLDHAFLFLLICAELFSIIKSAMKKPGPKKRVFERISVSLGKNQKRGLESLASGKEVSVADLVRKALDEAYGDDLRGKAQN